MDSVDTAADAPQTAHAAGNGTTGGWSDAMEKLRERYPDATPGILFCVHKLQNDPALRLRDFRDEALLHGVKLSGRSLHSAKVLLGLEKPAGRRRPARRDADLDDDIAAADGDSPLFRAASGAGAGGATDIGSMEERLIGTITSIQQNATAQSQRLRTAIEEAIEVLQRALKG